jgi:meiotically up-regulated gene 157 (Mug157) protein
VDATVGLVAYMEEVVKHRQVEKIFVNLEWKMSLVRPWCCWSCDIKMGLKELALEDVAWVHHVYGYGNGHSACMKDRKFTEAFTLLG